MVKTIAERFCDTYVVSDPSGNWSYILVPGLESNSRLMSNQSLIFGTGANLKKFTTFEGVPAYQIRNKFIDEIKRRADSAVGVYSCINWIFSEEVIKTYFTTPNLWILNNNAKAIKRSRTEISQRNRRRKTTSRDQLEIERDTRFMTRNLSVRTAAREMREMQRKGN